MNRAASPVRAHSLGPGVAEGLSWPRGREAAGLGAERERLLHHERLMGFAHGAGVGVVLVAGVVHTDVVEPRREPWFLLVLGVALVFALLYHFVLPRFWLSRGKVVVGLSVDAVLATEVMRMTGGHMSLLVFLYYLVVGAGALTLDARALYWVCAAVTACFLVLLAFDPLLRASPAEHAGHAAVLLASIWLVGLLAAAMARQVHRGERRWVESLRAQERIAEERAALSRDLGVQLDETRRLLATLGEQRETTRRLADMVLRAQEDERGRVARELHDEANQLVAALLTGVDVTEALAQRHGDPALVESVVRLRRVAAAALADLQRIAYELRPPALDEFGLEPALRRYVAQRTDGSALTATVEVDDAGHRLPPAVEVALYRIAQEAVANVEKHSGACHLTVRLRRGVALAELEVVDDGSGFDAAGRGAVSRGLGIAGMRERAALVGGALEVLSHPGAGTRVVARVPVAEEAVPHVEAVGRGVRDAGRTTPSRGAPG